MLFGIVASVVALLLWVRGEALARRVRREERLWGHRRYSAVSYN